MCNFCQLFQQSEKKFGMAAPTFTFDESKVIKRGRDGTVILRGLLGNRPIAVKRMDVRNIELAENEIRILESRDAHPNVVRYYDFRRDDNYIYLALEQCTGSLNEYVHSPKYNKAMPPSEVCIEIGDGLNYLHQLNIVHRNLKPSNILFLAVSDDLIMIKISDYSISRTMVDTESFTSSSTVGSISWAAPELLTPGQRRTVKADIFSLGHVYYFVLSGGRRLENLDTLEDGAQKLLITSMVAPNPEDRPTAAEILVQPAFWTPEKCIRFIQVLSNDAPSGFNFETYRGEVFPRTWTERLDASLVNTISRHRRYDGTSFGDLIRMIRNLTHHRSEMSATLTPILGATDESLVQYFNQRLPNLFYYAWLTGKPLQQSLTNFY